MTPEPLRRVLAATGYMLGSEPAPGVRLGDDARRTRRGRVFEPDASWRSPSSLTIYFRYEADTPDEDLVGSWRREIWNEGFAPLLWVVSPDRVDLYNGFGRPQQNDDAATHRLQTFLNVNKQLDALDALAGRLSMETGQFWQHKSIVDRKTGVDYQLLSDLGALEHDLITDLDRSVAQSLIGRAIFAQYLIDRAIVDDDQLEAIAGLRALPPILRDRSASDRLFAWLTDTFNGNMFPSTPDTSVDTTHLARVADFLEAVDPETGQRTLFPYQFDVIPIELISSIYEQFAHTATASTGNDGRPVIDASQLGVYYTRLPVVSLVLDEVLDGLTGKETVLDLTCGSGVFLVEALRRLVQLQSGQKTPTRELIRSVLHNQIYGVDISDAAVSIAAFSLYLAALELDPDPRPPEALRFKPLIDKTLLIGDARTVDRTEQGAAVLRSDGSLKLFDVIVGNPPWSFRGRVGTASRRLGRGDGPAQPRGESLDFVQRAADFAHEKTRFGMILSAMPFFSGSRTGATAAHEIVKRLAPGTIVNLSNLRSWLFPAATMPAVVFLARHRPQRADLITVVQVPWSHAGARTHTFEIAPSDINRLSLADWERQPVRLKTAALGRRRDLLLLDGITSENGSLDARLAGLGTKLRDGLILGRPVNRTRDASGLVGVEYLQTGDLRHFRIPATLPLFEDSVAQWPRERKVYCSPLLLVKEFLPKNARAVAAAADRDLVFSDAFFGAALPCASASVAHLLAGILSSSVASWFFIMTASEFGIWKRRLFRQDVGLLPVPDLDEALRSAAGRHILAIESELRTRSATEVDWAELDKAVFDLYGLDNTDRIVVQDGLFRATWEWQAGLALSVDAAETEADLLPYAKTFLSVIDTWLSARKRRHMRAEVFDLPPGDPLRIVRFVLAENPGTSETVVVTPDSDLGELLTRIGNRLSIRIARSLVGQRELRVHGRDEVVIIKPASRRHWLNVAALEDADAVLGESLGGALT